MTEQVRVFLLDDHEIVRRGVRELLEAEGDLVVVGRGLDGAEALARVPRRARRRRARRPAARTATA
jgi:DNA-binding NarL/FixJ family response regulator